MKKVRHMSRQAEKGETFTKLKKVIETLATWKGHNNNYSEANKSVCMVAMHYQLSFMISKLCFPLHSLTIVGAQCRAAY